MAATALVTDKHVTTPHPPSHPHTHLLALLCHRPLSHLTRLAARNDSTRCHGAVGEAPTCDTTNRLCLPTTSSRRPSSCSALLTARETLSRIILERESPDRPTNPPPPLFHCPLSFGGHGLLLQTAFSTGRNKCSVSWILLLPLHPTLSFSVSSVGRSVGRRRCCSVSSPLVDERGRCRSTEL